MENFGFLRDYVSQPQKNKYQLTIYAQNDSSVQICVKVQIYSLVFVGSVLLVPVD